jgi:ATP-binding cassette subfamily C (CFTR/MRP) protein 1
LATLTTLLIALRTSVASHRHSTLFIILIAKLVFTTAAFTLELLGPDGFDGMRWTDFVPGVASEGKIKLGATGMSGEEDSGGEKEEVQKACPRLRANIFQVLTFSWLTPMFVRFCSRASPSITHVRVVE